jgi:membrane complex biogenesis BtpA family protein
LGAIGGIPAQIGLFLGRIEMLGAGDYTLSFRHRPALVGMIHVLPTPGSPGQVGMEASLARAREDAKVLLEADFDGLLLENMHDFPPLREAEMGPEVPAYLAVLARELRQLAPPDIQVGIQVLFAAHRVAVAVAHAAGLDFLRAEAWSYGHLADKGWVEASAATTLRYAKAIGAGALAVWADVRKKHASHAATADLSLEEVLTGRTTGVAPHPEDFRRARQATPLPLVLGSGLTVQNAPQLAPLADALIVGTSLKRDGNWKNPIELKRAAALVSAVRGS